MKALLVTLGTEAFNRRSPIQLFPPTKEFTPQWRLARVMRAHAYAAAVRAAKSWPPARDCLCPWLFTDRQPPYPWCHGSPTRLDCVKRGYCNRDPNCGE